MRKIKKVLLLFIIVAMPSYSAHERAGTSAFSFLNINYNAKSSGMGGVGIGVSDGIYGVLLNPASVEEISNNQGLISYNPIVMDVRGGVLAFGQRKTMGTFVADIEYLSFGTIDGVDEHNVPTNQTWKPYSFSLGLTFAHTFFENISVGAKIKGIYDRLGGIDKISAGGLALDGGVQVKLYSSRLVYGIILRNIGFVLSDYSSSSTSSDNLPFLVGAGVSYTPKSIPSLMFAVDLRKSIDDYLNYSLGTEMAVYKRILFARVGINFSQEDLRNLSVVEYQKSNWNIITIGLGLNTPIRDTNIKFDVSLNFRTQGLTPGLNYSLILDF